MNANQEEQTDWHVVKTRLRPEEREYLDRVAQEQDRSIAFVIRMLVRDAKKRDEA